MTRRLKVLAFVEAATVTGPARNLIEFCRKAGDPSWQSGEGLLIDTTFATFLRSSGAATNSFITAAEKAGIQVERIDEKSRFDRAVIARMNDLAARLRPDIVQTHSVKSHFLVRLSGLAGRCPWIAFHHGYTDTDFKMRVYNQLDRWSLKRAGRVVTVSKAFKQQLERTGVDANKISVVQNSIDPSSFDTVTRASAERVRQRLRLSANSRMILSVGRLSREKGHADLVRAFAMFADRHPRLEPVLVIAGDGHERQNIENLSAELRVRERVILVGHTEDIKPYYLAAEMMVLPSHSEGSPNVLLEAMAAGLPVIATRVGGVPEIVIDNESALLVNAGNHKQMALALARVSTDAALREQLAEGGRKQIDANHSPRLRQQALTKIYHEVAAQGLVDSIGDSEGLPCADPGPACLRSEAR